MCDSEVVLEIGDLLGFVDLNGEEALQSEQVQKLEDYVRQCNDAYHTGAPLVADGVWDRMMEILRKVAPDSELVKNVWEDSEEKYTDSDGLVINHPMYSIMTIKSLDCDEFKQFLSRFPDGKYDMHFSAKLNGHGIRLIYKNGEFVAARSRARSSAGRDITKQLKVVLDKQGMSHVSELEGFDICEVRGEWVCPFENLDIARQYNKDIKSAFTAVSSMGRDSASEEEWGLLDFLAYEFIADDYIFSTKQEEYDFLNMDCGFQIPLAEVIEDLSRDTLVSELEDNILSDLEASVQDYEYYTDGIVMAFNDCSVFKSLGDDGGHYKYGNCALKIGYWKQDMYEGYVQCILWTKGKTKLSPVAIVASEPDIAVRRDGTEKLYIYSPNEIANWNQLGVVTASGNSVRRIPLYEPNNMVALDAYPGSIIHFHYGGEAGVVPCFEDGTPLLDGRVKQLVLEDDDYYEDDEDSVYY